MARPRSYSVFTGTLVVALVAALHAPAASQSAPFETATGPGPTRMRPYGEVGGCSEEPAAFHRCALEKAKQFNPPRTPDGRPDFQGFWSRVALRNLENLEEHAESLDTSGNKSVIMDPPDGRIPYQPWAAALRRTYFSTYLNPMVLCLPTGSPKVAYAPGVNQIIQTRDQMIFLADYAHVFRVVPTDGRPHIGPNISLFMGSARGRWEGNTLVVDVTNLNDRTWLDAIGNFYSDAVHVVERWTMIHPDVIHIAVTIDDPKVYTRPWTMAFGLRRNSDPRYEIWENACVEGSAEGLATHVGLKPYPGVIFPKTP
jgi:hypothetical protein